jgi:hypothetical protein
MKFFEELSAFEDGSFLSKRAINLFRSSPSKNKKGLKGTVLLRRFVSVL